MITTDMWIGRALLFAVLTFPVWGSVLAEWNSIRNNVNLQIEGSLVFWIFNIAILDLGIAALFLIREGNQQTFVNDWHAFWNWGGWLVLSLAIGNVWAMVISTDQKKGDIHTTDDFVTASYVLALVGAVVAVVLWGAYTVVSIIIASPIPPAQ